MLRIYLSVLILVLFSGSAHADQTPPATAQQPGTQATRIETDQKTGAIRFIVDGKEQARLDATGLHVRQGVFYGGALTDYGQSGYDAHAAGKP